MTDDTAAETPPDAASTPPDAASTPPDAASTPERTKSSRLGKVAVAILGVLAIVGLLASTLAVWTRTTLADSDRFAAIAEDVIAEPQVQAAIATRLTTEALAALALEERIEAVVPPVFGPVVGIITASVQAAVQRAFEAVLQANATQRIVVEVVRRSHAAFMAVLRGDALPDAVRIVDDAVTVNMIPVITLALNGVQERFGLLTDVAIPPASADGNPDEQIAALEEAFGRELSPTFGQVVLYRGDAVSDASTMVQAAREFVVQVDRWLWVLAVVTVALFAATVWLSDRKWRSVLLLAVGSAAALIIAREMIAQILDRVPEAVASVGARATVEIAATDLSNGLRNFTSVLLLVSVVVAVLAWWMPRRNTSST